MIVVLFLLGRFTLLEHAAENARGCFCIFSGQVKAFRKLLCRGLFLFGDACDHAGYRVDFATSVRQVVYATTGGRFPPHRRQSQRAAALGPETNCTKNHQKSDNDDEELSDFFAECHRKNLR
jgi:hypothetical protein